MLRSCWRSWLPWSRQPEVQGQGWRVARMRLTFLLRSG